MIEKKHLETARLLYHPSKEVEGLVVRIVELLEKHNVNGVRIDDSSLKLDELSVRMIAIEHSHCVLTIHWEPNPTISTTQDPYCSAFILTYEELNTIYSKLSKVFATR
jgi:hypothetical protein